MKITLNIGLRNKSGQDLDVIHAINHLYDIVGAPAKYTAFFISGDGREDTLVAVYNDGHIGMTRQIHRLAEVLNQDCIARHVDSVLVPNHGDLVGPGAASWGEFDPSKFIMIDGRTLSEWRLGPTQATPKRILSDDQARTISSAVDSLSLVGVKHIDIKIGDPEVAFGVGRDGVVVIIGQIDGKTKIERYENVNAWHQVYCAS